MLSDYERIQEHADKRYRLWNHFSAFAVSQDHLEDVEAIVIAATPGSENISQGKKIERIDLPAEIQKVLRKRREIPA